MKPFNWLGPPAINYKICKCGIYKIVDGIDWVIGPNGVCNNGKNVVFHSLAEFLCEVGFVIPCNSFVIPCNVQNKKWGGGTEKKLYLFLI